MIHAMLSLGCKNRQTANKEIVSVNKHCHCTASPDKVFNYIICSANNIQILKVFILYFTFSSIFYFDRLYLAVLCYFCYCFFIFVVY